MDVKSGLTAWMSGIKEDKCYSLLNPKSCNQGFQEKNAKIWPRPTRKGKAIHMFTLRSSKENHNHMLYKEAKKVIWQPDYQLLYGEV